MNPGELIDVAVISNPNSYVGLLGVDQSVLVLKKGNDIEESAIFDEIKHYNEISKRHEKWIPNYRESSYIDFKSSEVFVITNAMMEYSK